jgi:uncharacterized protein
MSPEQVQDDVCGEASLASESAQRILTLDIIRGVAVMGILVANMPAFALPTPAYFSPVACGGTGPAETTAWLMTFTVIEGKMRGLFSFLFGASMLLVIERAEASGQSAARVHFARIAVLLAIGLAHMYLIWWGDILAHYAMVGAIAFLFIRMSALQLLASSMVALAVSFYQALNGLLAMIGSAVRDTPQAIDIWNNFAWHFGLAPLEWIESQVLAYRGTWHQQVAWNWKHFDSPIDFLRNVGPETLAAMLLGMAAYRSGFLTGSWSCERYRRLAVVGLGIALPAYLLLGVSSIAHGFDQRWVYFASVVATGPFRLLAVVGYAALLILAIKPDSNIGRRLGAVGQAAFTNYLGTSILVTAIFYGWGLGQFAKWNRAEIYVVPPIIWVIMLLWSKPWLERFHHGPFEWLWRSLSRGRLQPMRRRTIGITT